MNAEYFAGLFDGEGCVHINNQYFTLSVTITMCHKPTIDKLYSEFGGNFRAKKPKTPNHRWAWCWSVQSDKALKFLRTIQPFVLTKKNEVDLAINAQEHRHRFPMIGRKGGGRDGSSKGEEYKLVMTRYREALQGLKKIEYKPDV